MRKGASIYHNAVHSRPLVKEKTYLLDSVLDAGNRSNRLCPIFGPGSSGLVFGAGFLDSPLVQSVTLWYIAWKTAYGLDNGPDEEATVTKEEFFHCRRRLDKTQKQVAEVLGVSLKAIHSYEQGWRRIPGHVERQMFFLISRKRTEPQRRRTCWEIKKCPAERKTKCPAWEFRAGNLCWFINGTICEGRVQRDWGEKMKICRSCQVLISLIQPE